MKTDIYNISGKVAGSMELPETVFGVKWNDSLMHQVVTAMQSNARPPVAHAKTRGEVRGGGKKPWAQKGTGRARHGSSRSPIWRGGGVTHGPRNDKNYSRAIPKKMRAKALYMALSRKFADGEILFVDSFGFSKPKTADAKKAMLAFGKLEGFKKMSASYNAALIALPEQNINFTKSFRNISSVSFDSIANLNPVMVLKHKYLIIENPEVSVRVVEKRLQKSTEITPEKVAKKAAAPKKVKKTTKTTK
jgi:large subunit ribosomal protein L4